MMNLVVIDSNEKTSTYKLYNQDKVIQWIRWLDNAGGYRWLDPFSSPKHILSCKQAPLDIATGTLGIATDDEPQPSVTFVSNCSGTETDFLDRYSQRRESR